MSPDHQLSERVYHTLKSELLGGIQEIKLAIAWLGARYHTSATPVREALLRLVGEGVVDINPTGGFSLPKLTESRVRDLYDLNMRVILAATAGAAMQVTEPPSATRAPQPTPVIDDLLLDIAGATHNQAMVALVESLNDRMRRIRRAELDELSNIDREIQIMTRQFRHGERTKLRRSLIAYHRRRMRHCPAIWARLYANTAAYID